MLIKNSDPTSFICRPQIFGALNIWCILTIGTRIAFYSAPSQMVAVQTAVVTPLLFKYR